MRLTKAALFLSAVAVTVAFDPMHLAHGPVAPAMAADTKPNGARFSDDTYKYLELFGDVFERVRKDYVEPVSDQELLENAINGMLTSLDPHSGYMATKKFQEFEQDNIKGEYGGIGVDVTMENGALKVISPFDETPAARAGIKPGDYIVAINGKPVMGRSLKEATDDLAGPIDTALTITVRRAGIDPFDLKLVRATVKLQSVRSRAEGDVGYVRISQFTEQTQPGLESAISDLKTKIGPKLKGYVVDLRNNPGGLFDQAIAVADDFLDRGEIVSTRSRQGDDTQRFNAKPGDLTEGKPLVVLINDGSASASEIVAGALQDHHRAIVLGTKSFGKGSVQTIIPLGRGDSAIRLTTARYYTPNGRSIQALGITPDIDVQQAQVTPIAQAGVPRAEADLKGALRNDQLGVDGKAKAPAAKPEARNDKDDVTDYQLARALDLLRGIALYQKTATVSRS